MYSEAELESAIAAGKLSRKDADALRAHVSTMRSAPIADEEQFRLVTGFNDIFVAIAGLLVLVGAGWLGGGLFHPAMAGVAIAAAAWGMAEYFTRQRRMALPSILFFLAFVFGLYWACLALYPGHTTGWPFFAAAQSRSFLLTQTAGAAIVVAASWLHW